MRVIETNVYSFSELSDEAKQKVVNEFSESPYYADWIFQEASDSLDKFCKLFGVKYRNIDYLEPYRNDYRIEIDSQYNEEILRLSGARLVSYLWNNFGADIFKPKWRGSLNETENFAFHKRVKLRQYRKGNVSRTYYSAIFRSPDCPLTGTCYDMNLLDGIIKAMECKDLNSDLEDLINGAISDLCHTIEKEYDYLRTEEAIAEHCEANQYEFEEDGSRF